VAKKNEPTIKAFLPKEKKESKGVDKHHKKKGKKK